MKKILIVDDEPSYIRLLTDQLSGIGYTIITATDGKKGLSVAKKERPDLILLDIKMPVMDGMAMLDQLRADEDIKSTKVIMLTNLEPDDNIITGVIKDQPTHYFVKSDTKFAELLDKINELLA